MSVQKEPLFFEQIYDKIKNKTVSKVCYDIKEDSFIFFAKVPAGKVKHNSEDALNDLFTQFIGLCAVKDKTCACGDIILADTEDWEKPLCPNCFEELNK